MARTIEPKTVCVCRGESDGKVLRGITARIILPQETFLEIAAIFTNVCKVAVFMHRV